MSSLSCSSTPPRPCSCPPSGRPTGSGRSTSDMFRVFFRRLTFRRRQLRLSPGKETLGDRLRKEKSKDYDDFSELWKHFRLIGDPTALSKEESAFLERFLAEQYELREKKRIQFLMRGSGIKESSSSMTSTGPLTQRSS